MAEKEFVPSLIEFRNSSKEDIIAKLHSTFLGIATMNADQVIAAYQTVTCLAQEMGLIENAMINKLRAAMFAQMKYLYHSERENSANKDALWHRFNCVTNSRVA
jgi:hypothetical protein